MDVRRPLLTTPAERRRQFQTEIRDVIREIEGLQERVRGIGRDLSDDYGGSAADARDTLGTASAALGLAVWFLRRTRRSLP